MPSAPFTAGHDAEKWAAGHVQEMYSPMVLMETTAPNATEELSMGRPRMKARTTMKQTALMGVPV